MCELICKEIQYSLLIPYLHKLIINDLCSLDISKWSVKTFHRLGSIINGLSDGDIAKISKETFENMIGTFGNGAPLSRRVIEALAKQFKEVCSAPPE